MRRQFVWPPGSRPVVEVDGRWRALAKDGALRAEYRRVEEEKWYAAKSWGDLCELAAQFCEGKFMSTPDHGGPRCPETVPIAKELAHANRQGFLTIGSQPGEDKKYGGFRYQQRAAVEGYASPEVVQRLRRLVDGTRLQVKVSERPRRNDYSQHVPVSRAVYPNGDVRVETHFGAVPGRRAHFVDLGRSDLTAGALFVAIVDPEWGPSRLLWDRLGQKDWNNPKPPARPSTPPAPNAGGATTGGGAGVSHASEGNAQLGQAAQNGESAQGAVQQVIDELQQMLQNFLAAAEESKHPEAETVSGQITQAIAQAEELQQFIGATKDATEAVKL